MINLYSFLGQPLKGGIGYALTRKLKYDEKDTLKFYDKLWDNLRIRLDYGIHDRIEDSMHDHIND